MTADRDAFLRIPANLNAVKNAAFQALTAHAHGLAVQYAGKGRPWNDRTPYLYKRTGSLAASVQKTPYVQLSVGASGEQRIYSNDPRARLHSLGGTITGRPWLTFRLHASPTETAPSGPWVRVRQVRIPARPFMEPAAQEATQDWGRHCEAALGRILGAL